MNNPHQQQHRQHYYSDRSSLSQQLCKTTIENLKIFYHSRFAKRTISQEEILTMYDMVFDKNYETNFNGKMFNYQQHRDYVHDSNDCYNGKITNFEAEILDTTTFRFTMDFHCGGGSQQVAPQGNNKKSSSYSYSSSVSVHKMHHLAIINPKNGKITTIKSMTGQAMMEVFRNINMGIRHQKYIHDIMTKRRSNNNTIGVINLEVPPKQSTRISSNIHKRRRQSQQVARQSIVSISQFLFHRRQ
mmetsp:Transcript_18615/g.20832  ORF Transcript_18615/g.20832 Transcript_18615/m.20832 type:complete len:244 (-) Transcript_18615:12-743(-)